MESIKFPEANVAIGEDQPEYETLHAHVSTKDDVTTIVACFELTEEEIQDIVTNKRVWYRQLKHPHSAMQPMKLLTSKPNLE